jgi:NAD+ kinase
VHPEIPAILITPICPHTLSFRPMLLPDSMELRVCVPFNSRSTAWASFDGRGRIELKRVCTSVIAFDACCADRFFFPSEGDHIKITASKYPFPTVCSVSQSTDWFQSIGRTLKWNERERQKSFVVVEERPLKKQHQHQKKAPPSDNGKDDEETLEDEEEDEVSEEEEEEEKYDIDDLSSTESAKTTPDKNSPQAAEGNFSDTSSNVPRQKVLEAQFDKSKEGQRVQEAARALAKGSPVLRKYGRSRSTSSGLRSGVETPDRFHGPHPHPPRLSPRHVAFAHSSDGGDCSSSTSMPPASAEGDMVSHRGDRGARDDMHSPRSHMGARSRIPRDRDVETDMRTPTAFEMSRARSPHTSRRHRAAETATQISYDGDAHPRRAFAVWGHDESDSAASDSDY